MPAETNQLANALRSMGAQAGVTAEQLRGVAANMQLQGVDRSQAISGISTIARSGQFSGDQISQVSQLAADAAARYGTSYADATSKIVAMSQNGVAAIEQVDNAWHFLTADQLAAVESMARSGDQAGALKVALDALAQSAAGAVQSGMSSATRATDEMKVSWSNLEDAFSRSEFIHREALGLGYAMSKLADAFADSNKASDQFWDSLNHAPPASVTSIAGAAPKQTAEQAQAYSDLTDRLKEQVTAENTAQGVRARSVALANADRDAEDQAAKMHLDAGQASQLRSLLEEQATQKLSAVIRDQSEALQLEARSANSVADAYARSTIEGLKAAAAREALLEHEKDSGVNVGQRTNDLLAQQAGAAITKGGEDVSNLTRSAEAQARIAQAARVSSAAEHEAEIQNKITAATYDLLAKAAASGNAAQIAEANKLAGSIGEQIKAEDVATQQKSIAEMLQQKRDDLALAEQELALQGRNTEASGAQLEVLKEQLDLKRQFPGIDQQDLDVLTRLAAAQGTVNAQIKEGQQEQKQFQQVAGSAASAIVNGFTEITNRTKDWRTALADTENQITKVLQTALVTDPLKNWLTEKIGSKTIGGLFGFGGSSSATAGGASGGNSADVNNLGQQLSTAFGSNLKTMNLASATIMVESGTITGGGSAAGGSSSSGGIGGFFSSLFSSTSSGAATSTAADTAVSSGLATSAATDYGVAESAIFHEGGKVGRPGPTRLVPLSLFATAPRYHSGIDFVGGERPAILQTGERVLSRGQNAAYRGGHSFTMGDVHIHGGDSQTLNSFRRTMSQVGSKFFSQANAANLRGRA